MASFGSSVDPSWKLPARTKIVEHRAYLALLLPCKRPANPETGGDMRELLAAGVAFCFLAVLELPAAGAADIKVLSDGPLRSVLTAIVDRFQRQTEHRVHLSFAAGPALKARVAGGEVAEILITPAAEAEDLTKQGKLNAGGQIAIARVGIGLAIREGVPVPEIGTLESLKETLLRADSLVFTNLASGTHFVKVAERLGITDDVKSKSTQLSNGAAVFDEVLKRNGRDIGIGSIIQIMDYGSKGLRLVGPLPSEVQFPTVFMAAIMTNAKAAEAAKEFIRYLRSPESQALFTAAGAS
jgi:molybdate transport system substrate-binding protein